MTSTLSSLLELLNALAYLYIVLMFLKTLRYLLARAAEGNGSSVRALEAKYSLKYYLLSTGVILSIFIPMHNIIGAAFVTGTLSYLLDLDVVPVIPGNRPA